MRKPFKHYCPAFGTTVVLLILASCGGSSPNTSPISSLPIHNEWTWVGGSNAIDQPGNYATEGTAAPGSLPGARAYASAWTDTTGNFWLFGGYGTATTNGSEGDHNDLWKYSNGQWTWVNGSNQIEQQGIYGTEGAPAAGNVPGARWQSASWTDAAGNFWLFGGLGNL